MSGTWRQVRVFSSLQGPGYEWYFEGLHRLVRPWLQQHPTTTYFFSKYAMPFPGDQSDTDFAALPAAFHIPTLNGNWHRSVRIRFREPVDVPPETVAAGAVSATSPVEKALKDLIEADQQRFWKSAFLPYDIGSGLGDLRFSPFTDQQATERKKRGETVAAILHGNCQLAMEAFTYAPSAVQIEQNAHEENQVLGTAFQSVGHMLANVWWDRDGNAANVWAVDAGGRFGVKI